MAASGRCMLQEGLRKPRSSRTASGGASRRITQWFTVVVVVQELFCNNRLLKDRFTRLKDKGSNVKPDSAQV